MSKLNSPKLRFPEFSGDWVEKKLGEVGNIISGGTPDTNIDYFWNGEIQWFTPTEIKTKYVSFSQRQITVQGLKKSSARLLPKGSLLLCTRATVGELSITLVECTTNQGFQSIIVNPENSNEFLYYWIKQNKNELYIRANGSTFLEISRNEILKINILMPSLPEQTKIANFLTSIDEKIEKLQTKKQSLEQYKKGMMQKLFNQEIRFKDDNGKDYEDWVWKKLGDIFSFKTTNSYSRDCLNYEVDNVKNIHYGDIHTKFKTMFNISNECVPYINIDISLEKINFECYCQEGDLIIADASEDYDDIGKAIEITQLNNERVLAGLHTLLARPEPYELAKGFGGYLIKTSKSRLQIKTIAQGTKVLSISTSRLANIKLHLPSLPEQTKIANFLTAIDEKIATVTKQHAQAQVFKKGLMQRLFV